MQSTPEIEQILNRKTRSNLNTLLVNGNVSTPLRKMRNKYIINNTCPFDSIAFIITMAYIDHPQYRVFIDSSDNIFLNFCKDLAVNGTSRISYMSRLEILKNMFDEQEGVMNVKIVDARCNVLFIVTALLKTAPSAIVYKTCSDKDCSGVKIEVPCPTIITEHLSNSNFKNLNDALNAYTIFKGLEYLCAQCSAKLIETKILQSHLFIETDVFSKDQQFPLHEFPLELVVDNLR